eukprot:2871857-Karenia_brevis.AAC.1
MATKVSRPSKEGLDRHTSLKPGETQGMATKVSGPSKEGLDRRKESGAAVGMAAKLLASSEEEEMPLSQ